MSHSDSVESKNKKGFPAGTRIVTDRGLVPIQDVKVSDMVLSKPESGEGELCYKPVILTISYDDKEIWELTYFEVEANIDISKLHKGKLLQLSRKGKMNTITTTPNYLFWIEAIGWTRLDEMQSGQIIATKEPDILGFVFSVQPRKKTDKPLIAASYSPRNIFDFDKKGFEIEDKDYYFFLEQRPDGYKKYLNNEDSPSPLIVNNQEPVHVINEIFTTTVYNFEVADYHTYFIFTEGLWVHNKNYVGHSAN